MSNELIKSWNWKIEKKETKNFHNFYFICARFFILSKFNENSFIHTIQIIK
jgi:hypothetical protein